MITVRDIAYVRYQVPDLERQASYLQDFGMRVHQQTPDVLLMAGHAGGYPIHISHQGPNKALGAGFKVDDADDLARIASQFGVPVRDNDELGAGQIVTLHDPDGFQVDLLHGGEVVEPMPTREAAALNTATTRPRVGRTTRVKPGPSQVMRLGHVVLKCVDFQAMMDFYQKVLGFKVSDSYYAVAPDATVAAFLHCGTPEGYTDHHTVALLSLGNSEPAVDHSAFEVLDWDDLICGNAYLKERNHRHAWGIGRHVQGSQVFDYWFDPFGNKVEHWTDGDLVNDQTPVGHEPLSPDALAQWAPPLPADFLS